MASSRRWASVAAASVGAAARRAAPTTRSAASTAATAAGPFEVELGGQPVVVLELGQPARASSRKSMTSASVSPYLRRRSWSSRRRSRTSACRSGSCSMRLAGRPHLGGDVGQLGRHVPQPADLAPRTGRRPSSAAMASASEAAAPSSPSSAREASAAASWWACGVGQQVLLGLERLVLVGIVEARPPRARRPGSAAGRSRGPGPARRRRARPGARRWPAPPAGPPRAGRGRCRRSGRAPRAARRRRAATGGRAGRGGRPGRRPGSTATRRWPGDRRRRPATAPRAGTTRRSDDLLAVDARTDPRRRPRSAPWRTIAGSARPPISSSMASTTSVLPAPVSPVTAVIPGRSTRVSSSMTPRSRTASSSSISDLASPVAQAELGLEDAVEVAGSERHQPGPVRRGRALDGVARARARRPCARRPPGRPAGGRSR